jgi:hypothetical protein
MAKWVSVIVHGLVGWAICGATITIGRQIMSMRATLAIHLVVAPLAFALLAWSHFKRHPGSAPLQTSLALVGLVIGLDAFLVAPVFEHSYVMFRSIIGTWIPFGLIWLASFRVGLMAKAIRKSSTAEHVQESPNKRMQLTKLRAAPERPDKVSPCAPAGRPDGGTAS